MTTPHPYAYALEWIKEGKLDRIEYNYKSRGPNVYGPVHEALVSLCAGDEGYTFRLRPEPKKYKLVNGVRVPMHEEVEPEVGASVCIASPLLTEGWLLGNWRITETMRSWLDAGFIYLNAEDAAACGLAMRKWEPCE